MIRAAPWVGGIVALATLGAAIQQKGVIGGSVHTALDFTPVIGTLKNLIELVRGRDFIADRRIPPPPVS